ncbi:MAG: hypothetical protein ACR2HH_14855 [Chthoniobacterales bacterium]
MLASLLLHVVIGLSLAAFNNGSTPLPPEDAPTELTVIDLSAPPPPVKPNPAYIETARESAEAPQEKTFESNANSIAASSVPVTGEAPLPSQEGKEQPYLEMQTRELALPNESKPAVPVPQPTIQPTPPPQPTATPTAAPTQKPKPSATPQPTPVTTPPPAATPEPERLAMLTATPPPALRDTDEVEATPPPEVGPTEPPTITRPRPETPASAFQPEKQQTRITGRISNRGPSSVNAVGTPLGKYQKAVSDAIGSRWYYYMKDKMDLVSIGTAHVEAEVDAKGKIKNLRVLSNNANEAFANICLQSFQEAQIPPIPPDLIATLPEGRLPVDIFFTTYANR